MERTYVKDIKASEETTVLVKGWIHRIRDLGHITFVHLRDKTGIIQFIIPYELGQWGAIQDRYIRDVFIHERQ